MSRSAGDESHDAEQAGCCVGIDPAEISREITAAERTIEMCRVRPWLGTLVEIRASGPASMLPRAIENGFAAIACVHEQMSPRESSSDLARLQVTPPGEIVSVHPWTWEVLSAAQLFAAWSDGQFDSTAFRGSKSVGRWLEIEMLANHRVRLMCPVTLDLGGIAKGFAVDRAVEGLRSAGATAGVVNAGGDLRVFGTQRQPVYLRDPYNRSRVWSAGELLEEAFATSSNAADSRGAGRLVRPDGRRLWIGRGSASVRAPSCMIADALCKVVANIGPRAARPLLEICGASAVVIARGELISTREIHHAA